MPKCSPCAINSLINMLKRGATSQANDYVRKYDLETMQSMGEALEAYHPNRLRPAKILEEARDIVRTATKERELLDKYPA